LKSIINNKSALAEEFHA